MAQPATVRASIAASLPAPSWPIRSSPAAVSSLPLHPAGLEAACFELHPDPQFLVTAEGEVVSSNRAARELIEKTHGPRVLAESLVADAGEFLREVREQIAAAIRQQAAALGLDLSLTSSFACSVDVIPLGPSESCALLVVRRREPRKLVDARERFRFTRAEQQVADRLARGLTVPQIAKQLEISIETVRCHLKQAFVKAGVHRQAELVAALLRD